MSKFIGIDLGTTFSAVAQVDETGRATIIHNEDGINITPSVVSFEGTFAAKQRFDEDATSGSPTCRTSRAIRSHSEAVSGRCHDWCGAKSTSPETSIG